MSKKRKRDDTAPPKDKKKSKPLKGAPEVGAAEIAEAVEAEGRVVYDNIRPAVRRELKESYGLWVGREERRWAVQMDAPPSVVDVVMEQLASVDSVQGDWKPKERNDLKSHGLLVYKEDGAWHATKGIPKIDALLARLNTLTKPPEVEGGKIYIAAGSSIESKAYKLAEQWRAYNQAGFLRRCAPLESHIRKFYQSQGYRLTPRYRVGCGYEDAWDPCSCGPCRNGDKTLTGYQFSVK